MIAKKEQGQEREVPETPETQTRQEEAPLSLGRGAGGEGPKHAADSLLCIDGKAAP